MSIRPGGSPSARSAYPSAAPLMAAALRNDLAALQEANRPLEDDTSLQIDAEGGASLTLDDLNETERSAALIGASPDAFKPIPWMNQRESAASNSNPGRH